MQRAPAMSAVRPRRAPFWPRRVLLAGGDSVVSRALLVFLRKEGFDAAVVSDDPGAWGSELSGRPFGADRDRGAASDADVVIVSPHVTGERRQALCQRVRDLGGAVPIVTLRDAGDTDERAPSSTPTGAVGGPRRVGELAQPVECGDATIAWPFRLREVLGTIDSLIVGESQAASA